MNEVLPSPSPKFHADKFSLLGAFARAFLQLKDARFRKVLINAVGLTLAAMVLAGAIGFAGLENLPTTGMPAVDTGLAILSGLGLLGALILIFPGVALAFVGLFLDDVVEAVEQRFYPGDRPGRALSFWQGMGYAIRFAAITIGLNLLVLPLYLILLFAFPLNLALYYALNGYLFGREYFELVALRHLTPMEAQMLRRRYHTRLFLFGVFVAFLFTIPVVNLITPLVATAAAVHIFKMLRASP